MSHPTSGSRSMKGCHTCRLRKKKCDELHPVCRNCLERSIPCYGYGAKPAWMDGKGIEAEFVKAIRKAAESNYRARRRGWKPSADLGVGSGGFGDDMCIGGAKGGAVGIEWSGMGDGAAGEGGGVVVGMGEEGNEDVLIPDFLEQDQGWNFPTGVGVATDQLMPWDSNFNMEPQLMGMDEDGLSYLSANKTLLDLRLKAPDDRRAMTKDSSTTSLSCAGSYKPSRFSSTVGTVSQTCTSRSRSPSSDSIDSIWWQSNFASDYNVRNKAELGLLMHYLDNVFGLQFGFSSLKPIEGWQTSQMRSQTPGRIFTGDTDSGPLDRGRGWYLSTLLKCRPLYFATLSISAWHQHLVRAEDVYVLWAPPGGKNPEDSKGLGSILSGEAKAGGFNWEAERNFMMTLKGLQGVLDELNAQGLRGVELLRARWMVLGTMCQVLSLEVFRTLGGNWLIHIRAARTFLSMIGSSSFTPSSSLVSSKSKSAKISAIPQGPKAPPRLDILEQVFTDDKHSILTQNDTAALKHFVTSFIWVDILSRASGLHPVPAKGLPITQPSFDYLPLMENGTLDLSRVMGCENWVFVGIAQIILLEHALSSKSPTSRLQASKSHDSSTLDLHSRATVLEAMFERGIRDLMQARDTATGTELSKLELHSNLVTHLFALSALTYLHVTTLGAYPFLPAIRSSVRRSLDALESLPPELLIRVSWPYAVTGCMVREGERERVRGVVERAVAEGWNVGTCWKGGLVVERCWALRDEVAKCEEVSGVGNEVSWVCAMESLGEKILLC